MSRWILVFALCLLLPGCDVATVALIMGSQDGGSGDDDAPLPAPTSSYGPKFQAWTAQIPAAGEVAARQGLVDAKGDPSQSLANTWTLIGNAAATAVFDPNAAAEPFNAILIQVSSDRNYSLDCVEVFDVNGAVIGHASGLPYSNLVNSPNDILGPPDTLAAVTNATEVGEDAFIFTIYTQPIDRFRINSQGVNQPPAPGDLAATGTYQHFSSVRPGGMAIDGNGLIHVTLSVGDTGRLVRYNLSGVIPAPTAENDTLLSSDLATAGTHSVALNSAGVVFTSCSVGSGLIQVRSFAAADLSPVNLAGFSSGLNGDRVEHNSIAVDSDGDLVVVGGFSSILSGRNHWRAKMLDSLPGSTIWQSPSGSLDNSSTTYWHAVTAGTSGDVLMTGDLLDSIFLGGTVQIYSNRINDGGTPTWVQEHPEGDVPSDVGHAIALDLAGNVYVAGSVGTDADGLDGVLLRYAGGAGTPDEVEYKGAPTMDAEALDVAVDPADGSIYVVGYEVVTGQGENIWVRKYVYDDDNDEFDVMWTRTHHGGFGNDRAISCAIYQNNLVVAGYETNGTGQTKLVLRVYEK